VLCVSCGFDLRTRKKVARTYKPMDVTWETNMPLAQRLTWFGLGQAGVLALGIMVMSMGTGALGFFASWPLFALTVAFIVGTFDQTRMTRDNRGRVTVIKTWRFCFFPLQPVTTEVVGFEGIVNGQYHDAGFWEWFLFVWLFPLGVIPALVWWFFVINRNHYYVALARDHGYPEVYVYRGQRQAQMEDVADTLREATGLKLDVG
jgi:hypothetical protein